MPRATDPCTLNRIAKLVAAGVQNSQIARQEHVSTKTISRAIARHLGGERFCSGGKKRPTPGRCSGCRAKLEDISKPCLFCQLKPPDQPAAGVVLIAGGNGTSHATILSQR